MEIVDELLVPQNMRDFAYNDQPKAKDDIFKILTQSEPKDVLDASAALACKLETYEATPAYEV